MFGAGSRTSFQSFRTYWILYALLPSLVFTSLTSLPRLPLSPPLVATNTGMTSTQQSQEHPTPESPYTTSSLDNVHTKSSSSTTKHFSPSELSRSFERPTHAKKDPTTLAGDASNQARRMESACMMITPSGSTGDLRSVLRGGSAAHSHLTVNQPSGSQASAALSAGMHVSLRPPRAPHFRPKLSRTIDNY
jgi:hypothetical protein